MVGDGAAQRPRALGRRGVEEAGAPLQNGPAHEPRPDGEGEITASMELVTRSRNHVRSPGSGASCVTGGGWEGRGGSTADKVALILHTGEVALGHQLLVGVLHGDDADLQMGGQRPLAGQLLPPPPDGRRGYPALTRR